MIKKFGLILYCLLFLSSCSEPKRKEKQVLEDVFLTDLRMSLIEESLNTTFHRMSFLKTLDTFQTSIELPLERMSLIEYYSANSYSASTTNCLILEYSDKAYVTLFKYDVSTQRWMYSRGTHVPINKVRSQRENIQNSPHWNEAAAADDDLDGDIATFTSIVKKTESQYPNTTVSKVQNNPNVNLYKMFVNLTEKED